MQQTYEKPSLSRKALETYTEVGEAKTASTLSRLEQCTAT